MANNLLFNILHRRTKTVIINHVQRRCMPVNVPPTATGKRRFRLAVETDPHKLVNYCCGINYRNDEPLVKLKPDEEYPDWLWKLRLTDKKQSWELEPGTKEYYLRLKEEENEANLVKRNRAKGEKKIVSKVLLQQQEYLKHIRFAALAHMEDDVGLEMNEIYTDWDANSAKKFRMSDFYLPMVEDRVLYMDKIEGNQMVKNYKYDADDSFQRRINMASRPPTTQHMQVHPIQDSKRRHRYSTQ